MHMFIIKGTCGDEMNKATLCNAFYLIYSKLYHFVYTCTLKRQRYEELTRVLEVDVISIVGVLQLVGHDT